MKRSVAVVAAVLLLLVFPAAVLAKFIAYHGPAAAGVDNADIDMDVVLKHGHHPKLVRFEFNNIPISECGSQAWISNSLQHPRQLQISKGKFHGKQKLHVGLATYVVTLSGHVSHQTAAGKLRIKGTEPGCSNVDTGSLAWSAPAV